jgi:septal ring factor EnvC (AmiA/AmiB activator)
VLENCPTLIYLADISEESNIAFRGEIKKFQYDLRDRRQQIVSLQREIEEMEKEIGRIEEEKSKAQARSRALESELRVAKTQLDELLSTNLDNENVIRMKVKLKKFLF